MANDSELGERRTRHRPEPRRVTPFIASDAAAEGMA